MHTLIVVAHPSKQGFSHEIARVYKAAAEKAGKKTEIIELYKTAWKKGHFEYHESRRKLSYPSKALQKKYQAKVAQANEIVWIFPVWWYDAPTIMVNFFTGVFTSGFAYGYGADKEMMKAKTQKIFCTAAGPSLYYILKCQPVRSLWRARFNFCGTKLRDFALLGSAEKRTLKSCGRFLEKVKRSASR